MFKRKRSTNLYPFRAHLRNSLPLHPPRAWDSVAGPFLAPGRAELELCLPQCGRLKATNPEASERRDSGCHVEAVTCWLLHLQLHHSSLSPTRETRVTDTGASFGWVMLGDSLFGGFKGDAKKARRPISRHPYAHMTQSCGRRSSLAGP